MVAEFLLVVRLVLVALAVGQDINYILKPELLSASIMVVEWGLQQPAVL
jgi:hypothetical protein